MRQFIKGGNSRFYFLFSFVLVMAACILGRAFSLQVLKYNIYSALAKDQHEVIEKLVPRRGEIFIQEKNDVWHSLATNRNFQTVFLSPKEVPQDKKDETAEKLSSVITDISKDEVLNKLKDSEDPYEPLKSKLSDDVASKIKEFNLKGVHLTAESWRWYPQGELASHILGFVGVKDNEKIGQYGIEQYYEIELKGKNGLLKSEKDAMGRWLLMGDYDMQPAEDGAKIYLTLDQNIQFTVEHRMKALIDKWKAPSGCAIVIEPKTGAIRAIASFPQFDPNDYKKSEIDYFINSCTQELYEPGSVFKPIVMAAGLDTGKVSPITTYTDTGAVQIAGYTIRNSQEKTYGLSTMTNVLEKSINTGVIFVQRQIGGDVFTNYIKSFGFDEPTGIDLAGETRGNISNLNSGREINYATASFGQGISVTPIEMATAIAAIANEGKLMRPYLAEKVLYDNGEEKLAQPQEVRQVVSAQTANKLTAMLVSTVKNGYDKIKIKNYYIAGKTGTAQIPDPKKGGYLETETIHTFIGYAPAYDPKFLILLKLDRPKGIQFASESLAPAFGDLAQYLLNYYEIPPEI